MITEEWDKILNIEYQKKYFVELKKFIDNEYKNKIIYPKYDDVFRALKYTSYNDVSVVIIGQDPYHGEGEACGLAFSVNKDTKIPPSLRNIYKELYNDLGIIKKDGDLSSWAKQGVLLLNSIMTVEKDRPLSHQNKGWELFTDNIIKSLSERKDPLVFILLGNYAKSKKILINKNNYIIESTHPSPFSANRGFIGSKIFSRTNDYLKIIKRKEIDW